MPKIPTFTARGRVTTDVPSVKSNVQTPIPTIAGQLQSTIARYYVAEKKEVTDKEAAESDEPKELDWDDVDQVDLNTGMRVTFNADPDITVRGKIYEVSFVTHDGNSRLHLKEVESPVNGQGIVVTDGVTNKGTSWYFNGTQFIKGQQKTTLNQAPTFDLYDNDGVSFTDAKYGVQNFTGNKLVSYKQGEGANDPVLGFPITYQNVNNIGDICFEFNWDNDSFVYNTVDKKIVQDTAASVVKINKSLTESTFESGWSLIESKSKQKVILFP